MVFLFIEVMVLVLLNTVSLHGIPIRKYPLPNCMWTFDINVSDPVFSPLKTLFEAHECRRLHTPPPLTHLSGSTIDHVYVRQVNVATAMLRHLHFSDDDAVLVALSTDKLGPMVYLLNIF